MFKPRPCRDCGQMMTRTRGAGVGRPHAGRNLCASCYVRACKAGTLDEFESTRRSRSECVEDYLFLIATGCPPAHAAGRMRMTSSALYAALYRARTAGDTRISVLPPVPQSERRRSA